MDSEEGKKGEVDRGRLRNLLIYSKTFCSRSRSHVLFPPRPPAQGPVRKDLVSARCKAWLEEREVQAGRAGGSLRIKPGRRGWVFEPARDIRALSLPYRGDRTEGTSDEQP